VEAAADDLPGVLGVMKAHLESEASGESVSPGRREGGREGGRGENVKREGKKK
jgi:hypothetical protein